MKRTGDAGQNFLEGTDRDDELYGLGGNDTLFGSLGADRMDGGTGIDTVSYFSYTTNSLLGGPVFHFSDSVDVDLQRTVQKGGFAEGDILLSIENVGGSKFDDIIKGDGGDNQITGSLGNDVLEGRDGDDVIAGDGLVVAEIDATEFDDSDADGNDTIDGGGGRDILIGDGGNDTLLGGAGDDKLFGGRGDDTLNGGTGANILDGGSGFDTASYAGIAHGVHVVFDQLVDKFFTVGIGGSTVAEAVSGVERFIGTSFNDLMEGNVVANIFEGGAGDDSLFGFNGDDTLNGGAGNDLLVGGNGNDTLIGGAGIDTASYADSLSGVTVTLGTVGTLNVPLVGPVPVQLVAGTGTGGTAFGDTLSLIENLVGTNFADTLTGSNVDNRLEGGGGGDTLSGGAGNDVLIGGSGIGTDLLTGGTGADVFLYQSLDDSRIVNGALQDIIQDFTVGQDKIDLRALGVDVADLMIGNAGTQAAVGVDQNANGAFDDGDFALLVTIQNGQPLTISDLLL